MKRTRKQRELGFFNGASKNHKFNNIEIEDVHNAKLKDMNKKKQLNKSKCKLIKSSGQRKFNNISYENMNQEKKLNVCSSWNNSNEKTSCKDEQLLKKKDFDKLRANEKIISSNISSKDFSFNMKSFTWENRERSEKGKHCSICLEVCRNRSCIDSCDHQFCFDCIIEWSDIESSCPLCKRSFSSIFIDRDEGIDMKVAIVHRKQGHPSGMPVCRTCWNSFDDKNLMVCIICNSGFHTYCIDPPITAPLSPSSWMCVPCSQGKNYDDQNEGAHYTSEYKASNEELSLLNNLEGDEEYVPSESENESDSESENASDPERLGSLYRKLRRTTKRRSNRIAALSLRKKKKPKNKKPQLFD